MSKGALDRFAPTWSSGELILVIPDRSVLLRKIGTAIVIVMFLGMVVLSPTDWYYWLIFVFQAAILYPYGRTGRLTLRLSPVTLAVDGWSLSKRHIKTVSWNEKQERIEITTSLGERTFQCSAKELHARALVRLLERWAGEEVSANWGKPAYWATLNPASLSDRAAQPFDAVHTEVGVRLHFAPGTHFQTAGVTLGTAAAVIAVLTLLIGPVTDLPGLSPFGIALDIVDVVVLGACLMTGALGLFLTFARFGEPTWIELDATGFTSPGLRSSYADVVSAELTRTGLQLVCNRGTIDIAHHDRDALVELRERIWALRAVAIQAERGSRAERAALGGLRGSAGTKSTNG